jgi:hypothetical protein
MNTTSSSSSSWNLKFCAWSPSRLKQITNGLSNLSQSPRHGQFTHTDTKQTAFQLPSAAFDLTGQNDVSQTKEAKVWSKF